MAAWGEVKGYDQVIANLNKEVARIEGATMEGLMEAGLKVLKVAQERTPVDTGNLKNSGFVRKQGKLGVTIGFSAAYAIYVHENLEAHHDTGQAKFLESALRDNRAAILRIIEMKARTK